MSPDSLMALLRQPVTPSPAQLSNVPAPFATDRSHPLPTSMQDTVGLGAAVLNDAPTKTAAAGEEDKDWAAATMPPLNRERAPAHTLPSPSTLSLDTTKAPPLLPPSSMQRERSAESNQSSNRLRLDVEGGKTAKPAHCTAPSPVMPLSLVRPADAAAAAGGVTNTMTRTALLAKAAGGETRRRSILHVSPTGTPALPPHESNSHAHGTDTNTNNAHHHHDNNSNDNNNNELLTREQTPPLVLHATGKKEHMLPPLSPGERATMSLERENPAAKADGTSVLLLGESRKLDTSAAMDATHMAAAAAVAAAAAAPPHPDVGTHAGDMSATHVCPVRGISNNDMNQTRLANRAKEQPPTSDATPPTTTAVARQPTPSTEEASRARHAKDEAAATAHVTTKSHDRRTSDRPILSSLPSLSSATAAHRTVQPSMAKDAATGSRAEEATPESKAALAPPHPRKHNAHAGADAEIVGDHSRIFTPLKGLEYDFPSSSVFAPERHRPSPQRSIHEPKHSENTDEHEKDNSVHRNDNNKQQQQQKTNEAPKTAGTDLDRSHSHELHSNRHLGQSGTPDGHAKSHTVTTPAAAPAAAAATDAKSSDENNTAVAVASQNAGQAQRPPRQSLPPSVSSTSLPQVHESGKPAPAQPTSTCPDTHSTPQGDHLLATSVGATDQATTAALPHTNSLRSPASKAHPEKNPPDTAAHGSVPAPPPPPSAQPNVSMSNNTLTGTNYATREPLTSSETVPSKVRFFQRRRSSMARDDRHSSRLSTRSLKMQLATHKRTESEIAAGLLARHKGSMTTTNMESKASDMRADHAGAGTTLSMTFHDGMQSMAEHPARVEGGVGSILSSGSLTVSRSMHRQPPVSGASSTRLLLSAIESNSHSLRKGSTLSMRTKTRRQSRADLRIWQDLGILSLEPRIAGNDRGGTGGGETAARCASASGSAFFSASTTTNNNAAYSVWQRYPIDPGQAAPAEMAGEAIELNHELHNVLIHIRHRNRPKKNDYPSHLPIKLATKQRNHRPRTPRSFYGKVGPQMGPDWFKAALDNVVCIESPDISVLEKVEKANKKDGDKKQERSPEPVASPS